MKKAIIIPILFLASLFHNFHAQNLSIGFETGYGLYQMETTKDVLKDFFRHNILQPQPVHNFPGYINFRPYIGMEYKYFNFGIGYTLMSTGTRYSINDYSGDYKMDIIMIGNAFDLYVETPVLKLKRFRFYVGSQGGIILNRMKIAESIYLSDGINEFNQFSDDKLSSTNYFIKPYFKSEFRIKNNIKTSLSIGYLKDIKENNLYLDGVSSQQSAFIADWDGWRLALGASFSFN